MERCVKCQYESQENQKKFNVFLCKICNSFAPENKEEFMKYIDEKIDQKVIETFRKNFKSKTQSQKKGMIKKAEQGKLMSRAAFGYKIQNKRLIKAENWRQVIEIFEEFLNKNISLSKLSKKYNLSVNGLKKILLNFTYIGKIKFNNQIYAGDHEPIITSTLFNHVQDKLERMGFKK
jgi:hypothetical protein